MIRWFRVYAAMMTLLSLLLPTSAVLAIGSIDGAALVGVGVAGMLLTALYGVATFVPFKPWGWTWGLVAIAVGVWASPIFAIPLLVLWFKPNVKAAFARL